MTVINKNVFKMTSSLEIGTPAGNGNKLATNEKIYTELNIVLNINYMKIN